MISKQKMSTQYQGHHLKKVESQSKKLCPNSISVSDQNARSAIYKNVIFVQMDFSPGTFRPYEVEWEIQAAYVKKLPDTIRQKEN